MEKKTHLLSPGTPVTAVVPSRLVLQISRIICASSSASVAGIISPTSIILLTTSAAVIAPIPRPASVARPVSSVRPVTGFIAVIVASVYRAVASSVRITVPFPFAISSL